MTLLQSTQEAEKEILQVLLWLTQAALCCIIISLLYIRNQHIIHSANTTHNVENERVKTKGKNPPCTVIFSSTLWCKRWTSTSNDLLNQALFPQSLRQTGTRPRCLQRQTVRKRERKDECERDRQADRQTDWKRRGENWNRPIKNYCSSMNVSCKCWHANCAFITFLMVC